MEPPGYRGCGEFVGSDRAKCDSYKKALMRLTYPHFPSISTSMWPSIPPLQRWRDRRLVRAAPRRYATALRRHDRWKAWDFRKHEQPHIPGNGCEFPTKQARDKCRRRQARELAYWAARDAMDPEVQYFEQHMRHVGRYSQAGFRARGY